MSIQYQNRGSLSLEKNPNNEDENRIKSSIHTANEVTKNDWFINQLVDTLSNDLTKDQQYNAMNELMKHYIDYITRYVAFYQAQNIDNTFSELIRTNIEAHDAAADKIIGQAESCAKELQQKRGKINDEFLSDYIKQMRNYKQQNRNKNTLIIQNGKTLDRLIGQKYKTPETLERIENIKKKFIALGDFNNFNDEMIQLTAELKAVIRIDDPEENVIKSISINNAALIGIEQDQAGCECKLI